MCARVIIACVAARQFHKPVSHTVRDESCWAWPCGCVHVFINLCLLLQVPTLDPLLRHIIQEHTALLFLSGSVSFLSVSLPAETVYHDQGFHHSSLLHLMIPFFFISSSHLLFHSLFFHPHQLKRKSFCLIFAAATCVSQPEQHLSLLSLNEFIDHVFQNSWIHEFPRP